MDDCVVRGAVPRGEKSRPYVYTSGIHRECQDKHNIFYNYRNSMSQLVELSHCLNNVPTL